jgi:hypothetical protein
MAMTERDVTPAWRCCLIAAFPLGLVSRALPDRPLPSPRIAQNGASGPARLGRSEWNTSNEDLTFCKWDGDPAGRAAGRETVALVRRPPRRYPKVRTAATSNPKTNSTSAARTALRRR